MARDKVFRVRLTQQELDKLERNAQERGICKCRIDSGLYQKITEFARLRDIEPLSLPRGIHVSRR